MKKSLLLVLSILCILSCKKKDDDSPVAVPNKFLSVERQFYLQGKAFFTEEFQASNSHIFIVEGVYRQWKKFDMEGNVLDSFFINELNGMPYFEVLNEEIFYFGERTNLWEPLDYIVTYNFDYQVTKKFHFPDVDFENNDNMFCTDGKRAYTVGYDPLKLLSFNLQDTTYIEFAQNEVQSWNLLGLSNEHLFHLSFPELTGARFILRKWNNQQNIVASRDITDNLPPGDDIVQDMVVSTKYVYICYSSEIMIFNQSDLSFAGKYVIPSSEILGGIHKADFFNNKLYLSRNSLNTEAALMQVLVEK